MNATKIEVADSREETARLDLDIRDVSNLFPTKFVPPKPTDTPESLFIRKMVENHPKHQHLPDQNHRVISRSGNKDILIFTDGACIGNGQADPKAGCAFVFRPAKPVGPQPVKYGTFMCRLKNRAELRTVIAAPQNKYWGNEGWERLIITTNSEYVVNGATTWIQGWQRKGWVTAKEPVKNQDLWEVLLKEVRMHADRGRYSLEVLFWLILWELSKEADAAAKKAALMDDRTHFLSYRGVKSSPTEMVTLEQSRSF
ncbi:uncharacterized protein PAC_08102 [Phialocephala subalpina]|uniref:ribonuclease H n=1 Tax=Phialocephala subalpina TaxID=576137 RepID=A0A1L7WZM0_9HELO|nr:uncharacterized protein PAC_08102 [Phialocephala subalpina]